MVTEGNTFVDESPVSVCLAPSSVVYCPENSEIDSPLMVRRVHFGSIFSFDILKGTKKRVLFLLLLHYQFKFSEFLNCFFCKTENTVEDLTQKVVKSHQEGSSQERPF